MRSDYGDRHGTGDHRSPGRLMCRRTARRRRPALAALVIAATGHGVIANTYATRRGYLQPARSSFRRLHFCVEQTELPGARLKPAHPDPNEPDGATGLIDLLQQPAGCLGVLSAC